jgi:hypothetical protein
MFFQLLGAKNRRRDVAHLLHSAYMATGSEGQMARTSYIEYRRRAAKAWRTKRANARRADYQRRANKAWRTKRANARRAEYQRRARKAWRTKRAGA